MAHELSPTCCPGGASQRRQPGFGLDSVLAVAGGKVMYDRLGKQL
jgi:hypothetical protein